MACPFLQKICLALLCLAPCIRSFSKGPSAGSFVPSLVPGVPEKPSTFRHRPTRKGRSIRESPDSALRSQPTSAAPQGRAVFTPSSRVASLPCRRVTRLHLHGYKLPGHVIRLLAEDGDRATFWPTAVLHVQVTPVSYRMALVDSSVPIFPLTMPGGQQEGADLGFPARLLTRYLLSLCTRQGDRDMGRNTASISRAVDHYSLKTPL